MSNLNLHYKNWKNNQINKRHKMTANLLKHVEQNNLILITFINMMTCDFHENKITINLIFISSIIYNQLIHYQIMTELNKISDYKSIETLFYFNIKIRETIKHRAWKKTDTEKVRKINNLFWISKHLNFFAEIKQYAVYLL